MSTYTALYNSSDVFADDISANSISANSASLSSLTCTNLAATSGTISSLTCTNLTATSGTISSLTSQAASINQMTGSTLTFSNVYGNTGEFKNTLYVTGSGSFVNYGNTYLNYLTASKPLKLNEFKQVTAGEIDLSSSNDVKNVLPISKGGTNNSSALSGNRIMVSSGSQIYECTEMSDGDLLIGVTSSAPTVAKISGTTNRVIVTNGPGSITLSTPQDIATNSSVTFGSMNVTSLTSTTSSLGSASASSMNVTSLTATTSSLGTSSASSLNVSTLNSTTSSLGISTASSLNVSTLTSTTSSLGSASASSLNVSTLTSTTSSLGSASVSSLTSSGTMSCGTNSMTHGSLTSGSISCGTNSVSCGTVYSTNVFADVGAIKALTSITGITTTSLSSTSLTATNSTLGSASVSSLTSSGTMSCGTNSMTCGNLSCSSLTSSGSMSCGTNSMTCGSMTSTGVTSSGPMKLTGTNYIELNSDSKTKETNAGKIGYDLFTTGLNIVGGGTSGATRTIYCYAENGFTANGPLTVGSWLTAGSGILLPTSGGTQTGLDYYEEATQSNTFSGIWSSAQSVTIRYNRIGKRVTCMVDTCMATANTSASIQVDTLVPSRFRPVQQFYSLLWVIDNSTNKTGNIRFLTDGNIYITADINSNNFAGSGTSGFASFSFSWLTS